MLGVITFSVVFPSYLNSNHLSLFQPRARVFHAAMICHADTVFHAWQGTVFHAWQGLAWRGYV